MAFIGRKPTASPLTASDITDGIISNAKLAQDIISAETELATAPASTDEFLISDAGTLKRLDASYIGEKNTPCFFASYTGSGVEISHGTWTKTEFTTEVIDEGSCYDTTNKRWTPGFIGKSFLSTGMWFYDASSDIEDIDIAFYKNGSTLGTFENRFLGDLNARRQRAWMTANIIVDHDADDYFEVYIKATTDGSGNIEVPSTSGSSTNWRSWFSGFKVFT